MLKKNTKNEDEKMSTERNNQEPTYKTALALLAVSTFTGMSLFGSASPASAIWEDEQIEEVEEIEGADLYDRTVETVGNISGDYISMQSITSPDLFENIGDGTFPVEWDVYIKPASGVSANDEIAVFLGYETTFDVNLSVQRCENEYIIPPNTNADSNSARGGCGGENENWEEAEVFATNYVDGVRSRAQVGSFNLQNGAYLRVTAEPQNGSRLGDTIDLEIIGESRSLGELVAIGNTSGSGRTQAISSSDIAQPGNLDDDYEEDSDTITNEDDNEATSNEEGSDAEPSVPEDEENANENEEQVPGNDAFSRDFEDTNNNNEEATEDELPYELIIGAVILALIIGVAVFFVSKKRKNRYEDDDEYLDDEDDEDYEEEDYPYERRTSGSFD